MVRYGKSLKKLVKNVLKFCRRHNLPLHRSKSKNEKYDNHVVLALYNLFCFADKSYEKFKTWLEPCMKELFGISSVPAVSTLWVAWRRFPPWFLRRLLRLSGRGGRDKCAALDPTHFQISRPSVSYCKRINRKLEREPNRKTTIVSGTRSLRILDAKIAKYHRRHGLDDIPKMIGDWIKGRTVVADCEFDAEERFHKLIAAAGGKSVAPLRQKNVAYHRTKGSRRKQLRRKWPGRSYKRRGLSECVNSMIKRVMGETLRGLCVGQQARHFYAKCFTHNMLLRTQK